MNKARGDSRAEDDARVLRRVRVSSFSSLARLIFFGSLFICGRERCKLHDLINCICENERASAFLHRQRKVKKEKRAVKARQSQLNSFQSARSLIFVSLSIGAKEKCWLACIRTRIAWLSSGYVPCILKRRTTKDVRRGSPSLSIESNTDLNRNTNSFEVLTSRKLSSPVASEKNRWPEVEVRGKVAPLGKSYFQYVHSIDTCDKPVYSFIFPVLCNFLRIANE